MTESDLRALLQLPYVQAALLVAGTLLLAALADRLFSRVLRRWVARTESQLAEGMVRILHWPLFVSVVLVGLGMATTRLDLPRPFPFALHGILKTLAVAVWLVFGFRLTRLAVDYFRRHRERFRLADSRTLPLFENLARVLLVAGGAYLLLVAWNLDLTPWLASAGIVGIALGFAAKDTLANLFAGVFILADAPYKVGDFIVLESGERGRVTQIGIRSTRILTQDDVEITVPNAVMGNSKIINESGGPWEKQRVRVQVSVAYGSDIDQVRRVLLEVASSCPDVVPDPEPRVRFRAFGESGLEIDLLCWIDEPVLRGRVLDGLYTAVYKRLAQEGIEIPYPKRDLYVRNWPSDPSPSSPDDS